MVDAAQCCSALKEAGFKNILLPDTEAYQARTESYWSVCAQLTPYCIVQPTTAEEVALAVTTLKDGTSCQFAVRSGGHTVWPGSNNIKDGVTIDLGLMNKTTYDAERGLAAIQPGATWRQVYETLTPHGVTVAGGRASQVGVAGFLTGGGNSFYTARRGFACDNVVNYEVVLASGAIINANAAEHSDLFRALKGGSGNFGIVTRFDMDAFEAPDLWGGLVTYPSSTTEQHIAAYVDWTDNVEKHQDSSSILIWMSMPSMKDIIIIAAYDDTTGAEFPPAFDKFKAIPDALSSTLRVDNHLNITNELDQTTGYCGIWFSLTCKNDARVYKRFVGLFEQFTADFKAQSPDGDFMTQALVQAIPTVFARHSAARGGNMLGLEREADNAVIVQVTLAVKGAEQEAVGRERMAAYRRDIGRYSDEVGAAVDWCYLNYADSAQDPLGSYGPENVARMRAVAERYDSEGVFQRRVPGGFKISKVALDGLTAC